MKIGAIIAEYDPFHNGHKKHIQSLKKICNAIIILMSGNLTQRAEFAKFDKWTRTKAALMCGADLVLEIPSLFCCSSAEKFAYGAMGIVQKLNCVKTLSFGSECGKISVLKKIAKQCKNVDEDEKMKLYLKQGFSYPKARALTLKPFENILSMPNNILGIEYIKASMNLNLKIEFKTIKRTNSTHNSAPFKNFASSSYIRHNLNLMQKFVPKETLNLYSKKINVPDEFLFYNLKMKNLEQLKKLPDMTEGLENRVFKSIKNATNLNEFFNLTKTKRYTMSRIKRIAIYALLNIEKQLIDNLPSYSRILGFNETGKKIASIFKKNKQLMVSSNFKNIAKKFPYSTSIDSKVTDIVSMFQTKKQPQGLDFKQKPIIV